MAHNSKYMRQPNLSKMQTDYLEEHDLEAAGLGGNKQLGTNLFGRETRQSSRKDERTDELPSNRICIAYQTPAFPSQAGFSRKPSTHHSLRSGQFE